MGLGMINLTWGFSDALHCQLFDLGTDSGLTMLSELDSVGKDLQDVRIMTDVGDVPIQEMRDCGVNDDRLMQTITDAVKLVMAEVGTARFCLQYFK